MLKARRHGDTRLQLSMVSFQSGRHGHLVYDGGGLKVTSLGLWSVLGRRMDGWMAERVEEGIQTERERDRRADPGNKTKA